MNAKKIMGAVLVALLAAALFVGAGAAATDKTVFLYQNLGTTQGDYAGTWTLGSQSLVLSGDATTGYYFAPGSNFVEGTYKQGDDKLTIKYPTATMSGVAGVSPNQYMVIDGTYYTPDTVTISAASVATGAQTSDIVGYRVTYPDGSVIIESAVTATELTKLGKYTIQPVFAGNLFVAGTPADLVFSKATYTITVADAADVVLSSTVESIIESGVTGITVTAQPGSSVTVTAEKFTILSVNGNTSGVTQSSVTFDMPNTGKTVVYVQAGTETGTGKIKADDETVSITITAGAITAKAEKDSYYIGDDVKLTGTSTAGNDLRVYIEGTNVKLNQTLKNIEVKADGTWEVKLTYADLLTAAAKNKLDAGTYTVYISNKDYNAQANSSNAWELKTANLKTYTTVSLALKQPFISVTDAPAVAVKGADYKVTGTAEATDNLYVYIFGTNFFAAKTNAVATTAADTPLPTGVVNVAGTDIGMTVSVDKNEFTVEFEVPESGMAPGQYFMVIQHPMYDEKFNIWADESKITTAATVNNAYSANKSILFDTDDRQSANAAQALCDALDTQNIDDMYVKLSFVVANGVSTINPIPSEITKGSKLTVSGTTNTGADKIVTVEMVSTAFAAVPKENVGSASFIALTTKTDENGNWEVTFDTTGLNIDEYTVTAAVEGFEGSTSAKVNVIEGEPTEQPTTQPTETEQPTTQPTETEAPTTPGFGALAALAGLGAVAVLLLRRE